MDTDQAVTALTEALVGLGVAVRDDAAGEDGTDLVLEPGSSRVRVTSRSLVDSPGATRLLARLADQPGQLVVVADRITEDARRLLVAHGAGFLDLRGHVAVRTGHLVIDADVVPSVARADRVDPLGGGAGFEVAVALLMSGSARPSVRQLARDLGRSPSTVSEVLKALRRDGLVDEERRVPDTGLFWRVAERWPTTRTYLSELPPGTGSRTTTPLRVGLDDPERSTGWALTESVAAAVYAAPMAVRSDQVLDFYVPDVGVLRRAERLLGAASSPAAAACAVRVAPVPAVCSHRVASPSSSFPWPLAHPVAVALDLAQDRGRGREVLDAWTPVGWSRVW